MVYGLLSAGLESAFKSAPMDAHKNLGIRSAVAVLLLTPLAHNCEILTCHAAAARASPDVLVEIGAVLAKWQSKSGVDPYQPRRSDGPGELAWRARMASEAGKAQYAVRVIFECIHARWRNWNLRQVNVRGSEKVRAIVTLYAFTNNVLQGLRLQQQHFLAANRSQERSLVTA
jgi:hypothetical protein